MQKIKNKIKNKIKPKRKRKPRRLPKVDIDGNWKGLIFEKMLTFAERMLRLSEKNESLYEKYLSELLKDTPMKGSTMGFQGLDRTKTRQRLERVLLGKQLAEYKAEIIAEAVAERQKAEEIMIAERKKAEAERQKAEAKSEAEKQLLIFKMFKELNIDLAVIAKMTDKTVVEIEQIIKKVAADLKKD